VEYIILTKIIENITQKSFLKVLQEQILIPLKMSHSGLISNKYKPKGLVDSYSINDSTKTILKDEPYFAENFFGAGAMYSSAEDLFKFDQGIFQENLLSPLTQNYSSNQTQNLGMLLLAYGTPMDMEHLANLLFIVLAGF
jgi:CubicO group peptidase (beta-lactamase class C family)